jgi:hypothetical protein
VDDPACHSIVFGVDDATARAAEAQRQLVDAALSPILAAIGRNRGDLVQFWTFTITSQPMLIYDPTTGNIPFPNDILINPATGLVSLPIAPGDPMAALKMQLNTLDGFSVSAPETATVALPAGDTIDPASLVAGASALLVNLNPSPSAEQPTFVATSAFGNTIALQPIVALLPDQNRYAAILTGLMKDSAGQPILPPPTMVLLLSTNPLFDGMHSTVNVLDDMQAAALEMLRMALQPLFAGLEQKGVPRSAIVAAWTFTTESIARPLLAVDAFPYQAHLSTDVTVSTVVGQTELQAKQATLPFPVADIRAIVLGTFTSENVVDPATSAIDFMRVPMAPEPQGDVFVVQPPPGDPPTTLKFWMSLPTSMPPGGAPVVILQHGLTSWRGDLLSIANDFAKAGFAAIAFDLDFHGSRTICISDDQCVSGSCMNGFCPGGLKLESPTMDPLACSISLLSGDPNDCNPVASGAAAINVANLFMTKANGQQYVVDASQLVRVLQGTTAAGLEAQLAAQPGGLTFDQGHLQFLGVSLGSIEGALFNSVDPNPRVSVLNVGAAHVFDAIANGAFAPLVDQFLASQGIQRGTPQFAQLDSTARWILDPVDPFSVARFIQMTPLTSYVTMVPNAPKPVIVQEAGMDMVIPPQFQADLAFALFGPPGLDAMGHARGRQNDGTFVSTFFANAVHTTLLTVQPPSAGVPMRAQAETFIATGGASLTPGEAP